MAHRVAGELNVTPWDALLGEVRRTAYRVGWLESKLAEAVEDEDLVRGGRLYEFVRWQERERAQLARVAKMAIDGGVAERIVAQVEADGRALAGVGLRLLDRLADLGLLSGDEDTMETARGILRTELLALDAIEGELIEEEGNTL